MIIIYGPRDKKPIDITCINVTSSSKNFGKNLSPFYLGPCKLYGDLVSLNMENAWQYAKLYWDQVDYALRVIKETVPSDDYWDWAIKGWNKQWADRYPRGKNIAPLGHWWDGKLLGYEEARRKIYIPLYAEAVRKTAAWQELVTLYQREGKVALFDFDGYNNEGLSWEEIIKDTNKKMGHAFVLGMMLEGIV